VAALGFEWMPGFGKAAMGPDVAIFKKGSHAAAYALARMDAEAAELQKSLQRRRGEPPLIAGLQAQAQAAAQQAHAQAQAPYGQPQQGQRAGGGGGGAGGGASSGAGSGRASGLANAGRKIAGGGYSGGGNGTLSTSPMRGREGGHAGGHAGAGVALAASGCPRAPCRRHPNLASATTACWRPTSTPSSPTPTCTRILSTTLRSPCCCWRTTRASTRGLRSAGCATRRRHSAPTLLCSTRCWRPRGARSLL
jgi:hypothetical protein